MSPSAVTGGIRRAVARPTPQNPKAWRAENDMRAVALYFKYTRAQALSSAGYRNPGSSRGLPRTVRIAAASLSATRRLTYAHGEDGPLGALIKSAKQPISQDAARLLRIARPGKFRRIVSATRIYISRPCEGGGRWPAPAPRARSALCAIACVGGLPRCNAPLGPSAQMVLRRALRHWPCPAERSRGSPMGDEAIRTPPRRLLGRTASD